MNDNMPTSVVLNRAADLIEKRGWARGNCGMAVAGPTCLEGAIAAALGTKIAFYGGMKINERDLANGQAFYDYTNELRHSAPFEAMRRYLNVRGDALYPFNDSPDRTAEQVIATLRAAAVIEAARESKAEVSA